MSGPWTKTTFKSLVRILEDSGFLTLSEAEISSKCSRVTLIDACFGEGGGEDGKKNEDG